MTDTMTALRRRQRQAQRAESMTIEVDGVPVDCTYYLDGDYYPGNEYDPPEVPSVVLVSAEIGGVDVTHWDDGLQITWNLEQALFGGAS